jgi:hypothetical protein
MLDTVPAEIPYIGLEKARRRRKAGGATRRIGLVWAGGRDHVNDRNRSASLIHFKPLAELPGIDWVSLQLGEPAGQIETAEWSLEAPLTDGAGFAETAAIIQGLDLVIAVDTSVAHLAGAMGKSTWLLLSYAPEWRWLLERADTPWYPTMRLFRQRSLGDWAGLVADVVEALRSKSID